MKCGERSIQIWGMNGGLGVWAALLNLLALQTPVLPPTITDQIRLWELERDRLRFTEGRVTSGDFIHGQRETSRSSLSKDNALKFGVTEWLGDMIWQDTRSWVLSSKFILSNWC